MTTTLNSILQALRIGPNVSQTPQAAHNTFPRQNTNGTLPSGLPEIRLVDVAEHDDYTDCWVVIYDRIYDLTRFLRAHPGGEDVIMDHAGRDATLAFRGTGHSRDAIEQMRDFLIGELPEKERIFRSTNRQNILSSGIPD